MQHDHEAKTQLWKQKFLKDIVWYVLNIITKVAEVLLARLPFKLTFKATSSKCSFSLSKPPLPGQDNQTNCHMVMYIVCYIYKDQDLAYKVALVPLLGNAALSQGECASQSPRLHQNNQTIKFVLVHFLALKYAEITLSNQSQWSDQSQHHSGRRSIGSKCSFFSPLKATKLAMKRQLMWNLAINRNCTIWWQMEMIITLEPELRIKSLLRFWSQKASD